MEVGIERLAALAFIVTGLSHIAAPRAWTRFFIIMRDQGEAAGLLNAYVHMPLGLLIVAFHPVWSGPGLLVTLVGAFAGIRYFGLLGLLVGPLALSYFFELIRMYKEEYLKPRPRLRSVRS